MPDLSAFVPKGMSLRRTFSTSGTKTVEFGIGTVRINEHAEQSDGKIIIGGAFSSYSNVSVNNILRLESNGELDTAFKANMGNGPNYIASNTSDVYSVCVQPDGKILVGGEFDEFSGVSQQGLVRLNSNGTVDTAFNANVANLLDRSISCSVFSIDLQSDGKIILGGDFLQIYSSTASPTAYSTIGICRLNSDGTIDTSFISNATNGPASNAVTEVVVQSDDKILVGGLFSGWLSSGSSTSVGNFVRLNSTGALDTTFTTALGTGTNGTVYALALQSDGSVLIGGNFSSFNGTSCEIARVSSTGTFDTSFNTNVGTGLASGDLIRGISVQSDGKILVGGSFESWSGTTIRDLVRLNSNGTLDTAFTTANGSGASSYGQIRTASQLASGDILLTGDEFSSWNGTRVGSIVTLTSAGVKTTTFLPQPEIVFAVVVGGGGAGGNGISDACGGGGAGGVVWGMVPAVTSVFVGTGGIITPGTASRYSTLIAGGGGVGGNDLNASAGVQAGAGGGQGLSGGNQSLVLGGLGSVLMHSIGGRGGGAVGVDNGSSLTGTNGIFGTSGGGGGAAHSGDNGANNTTAGAGGNGLVGGGGAGAYCDDSLNTGVVTSGAGGEGVYPGGASATRTGTGIKSASGGGGGGLLGAGSAGTSLLGTAGVTGGAGGLGGGGGGGNADKGSGSSGGAGGAGCVLLYW